MTSPAEQPPYSYDPGQHDAATVITGPDPHDSLIKAITLTALSHALLADPSRDTPADMHTRVATIMDRRDEIIAGTQDEPRGEMNASRRRAAQTRDAAIGNLLVPAGNMQPMPRWDSGRRDQPAGTQSKGEYVLQAAAVGSLVRDILSEPVVVPQQRTRLQRLRSALRRRGGPETTILVPNPWFAEQLPRRVARLGHIALEKYQGALLARATQSQQQAGTAPNNTTTANSTYHRAA